MRRLKTLEVERLTVTTLRSCCALLGFSDTQVTAFLETKRQPLIGLICDRANSDCDEAIKSSAGGGSRGSGHSDPTAERAIQWRRDNAGLAAGNLLDELRNASNAMLRAERNGRSLLAITPDQAKKLLRASAANAATGTLDTDGNTDELRPGCANCGVTVLNTRDDRLRSGRCSACYSWRLDHNGNERPIVREEVA